jgi:hypothetical protein
LLKPKASSPQQVYRAVLEYKTKFPDKAVIYSGDGADRNGWAVLMAGGSLPNVKVKDVSFLQAAAAMQPTAIGDDWYLGGEQGMILYNLADKIDIDLRGAKINFEVVWVSASTGEINKTKQGIKGGNLTSFKKPSKDSVLWLKKK